MRPFHVVVVVVVDGFCLFFILKEVLRKMTRMIRKKKLEFNAENMNANKQHKRKKLNAFDKAASNMFSLEILLP